MWQNIFQMSPNITRYFPVVLVIFHIIGLVLFTQFERASDSTWFNLALCGTLVLLTEEKLKTAILIFLLIFTGGFVIELIGTKTGYLFGNYEYGPGLGWRLFGVSIMIGVNWYAIVVAASSVAKLVTNNRIVQIAIGALLCVGIDFVIEPVAIKFQFWSWDDGEIPIYNYITWFIFAALFCAVYLRTTTRLNKTAAWLFFIWLSFFLILNAL